MLTSPDPHYHGSTPKVAFEIGQAIRSLDVQGRGERWRLIGFRLQFMGPGRQSIGLRRQFIGLRRGPRSLSCLLTVVASSAGGRAWHKAVDWAWASSAAGSSRASTSAPGWGFATPTCEGSGARTPGEPKRPRPSPDRSASGDAKAFASIEAMVAAPEIDCIWICGPNHARIENMERIVEALGKGGKLVGIACEKPLGAERGRGAPHGRARDEGRGAARLPRRPALLAGPRARSGDRVGARGRAQRPALPGARGGRAQRAPHAVVLAGRPAGRRRPERHDVPQPRGGAAPAHQAGRRRGTASGPRRSRPRSHRSSGRGPSTPICCAR